MDDAGRPVALVTGAGGNIGRALALAFASEGYDLVLHQRDPSAAVLDEAVHQAGRVGASTRTVHADLTDVAQIRRMFESLDDLSLSVLVNAAGTYPPVDFLTSTPEDWLTSYSLNVVAAVSCTQQAVPLMRHGGAVINIASIAAHRSAPDHGPYAGSKAALLSVTRTTALALAPHGVRVNAVSPGLVWRDGLDGAWPEGLASWRARAPLGSPVLADDVAAMCVFLAGSSAVTGQELIIDAGISSQADY